MDIEHDQSGGIDSAEIGARIDRLPATFHVWKLVVLVSLAAFFESYDIVLTGYIAPGLFRDHILTPTTAGLFGTSGMAGFIAALFAGLWVGTLIFGFFADRFGRRLIFTAALLAYTVCNVMMAFQTDPFGLYLWRFLAGVGIGIELITVDAYISELSPAHMRGRAFAVNNIIVISAIPTAALLAYLLVPRTVFGLSGWRWVVLLGTAAAIVVWYVRLVVPESPRWLAAHGRLAEANRITSALETRVRLEYRQELPPLAPLPPPVSASTFIDMFKGVYARRTLMLVIFNIFQTIGVYGILNWIPTFLFSQGIEITRTLGYTFIIALAAPVGPLLGYAVADRIERKWQIVGAAGCMALFGVIFAASRSSAVLILMGILMNLAVGIFTYGLHAYQPELYPTGIRARAVGFVYSFSRISAVFGAFFIAYFLRNFGTAGVFAFIAAAMVIVMVVISAMGPRTSGRALDEISH